MKYLFRICTFTLLMLVIISKSFGSIINVKKYGAKGDGKTDDTKAIQTAIEASSAAESNTVYFPKGTYLIGSFTHTTNYLENYCLRIHSNIVFKGDGKNSILLQASHIFDKTDSMANAHFFYGTGIQNIDFNGLTIDLNGMNNLVPKGIIKNHCAIYIHDGNNVTISNILIKNCSGTNMIIISGKGNKAIIEQSVFLNGGNYTGSKTPNLHQIDFSFIYTEWDNTIIRNNRIEQQDVDIALCGYTGGIEIHGSYCKASGNRITGCYPGIYISSSWQPMLNTSVENNQLLQCIKGISFWVHYQMNNITIRNNIIQLTHSRSLKPNLITGIEVPNGNSENYSFNLANNAALRNINITGNSISAILAVNSKDKSAGLVLHSFQNSTISNNLISGMNYAGIVLQGSKWGINSLEIRNNDFKDFKQNNDEKAVGGYIVITDTYSPGAINPPGMTNLFIQENHFVRNNIQLKGLNNAMVKGKFFGAFIALPEYMHKQVHFDKNDFSDNDEKVVFLKTN